MKLATAKEHRDFFHKNGWIEFEEFIPKETTEQISQALDAVLAERLKVSGEQLRFTSPDKLYHQGRDVWRTSPILQKFVMQTRFAELASELVEVKSLRMGYDQLLPAPVHMQTFEGTQEVYANFVSKKASIEAVSCLTGVSCGFLVAIDDKTSTGQEAITAEGIDVFPNKRGNVIYFKPDVLINWSALYAHPGQRFFLVVYTSLYSLYFLQPEDPHTHSLKRLGYIFNDKLNDKLHPIVYRS